MLDKPIKKCYDDGTILNDRSVLIMKKVFILVICCLLILGCFLGCGGTTEEETPEDNAPEDNAPEEQRVMYSESKGFYHTLGDLNELDVGIYSVKTFSVSSMGSEGGYAAKWLIVEDDGGLKLLEPITGYWNYIEIIEEGS